MSTLWGWYAKLAYMILIRLNITILYKLYYLWKLSRRYLYQLCFNSFREILTALQLICHCFLIALTLQSIDLSLVGWSCMIKPNYMNNNHTDLDVFIIYYKNLQSLGVHGKSVRRVYKCIQLFISISLDLLKIR